MKKKNNMVGFIALIVAIVGLSIGFAAFSTTLTVDFGNTKVTPSSSDWDVTYVCTPTATASGTATCGKGSVSGTTWASLTATLKRPGDKCVWKCTIENSGKYIAYLKSISGGAKTCTPAATSAIATEACSDITFTKSPGSAGSSIAVGGSQAVTLTLNYPSGSQPTDETLNITISNITYNYSSTE